MKYISYLFSMILILLTFAAGQERKIIAAPVIIETGDTLRIAPGAEYLFREFSGITVKGHLKAIGTKEEPIVFTSVADTAEGGGTSFDWDGVEITGGGSAELAYVLIANAVNGISAESAHGLILEKCVFKNIGYSYLSVAGQDVQDVKEAEPYTYIAPAIPTPSELAAAVTLDTAATSSKPPRDPRRAWRRALIGAGAATAVGGGVSFYIARQKQQAYNSYVPGNPDFDKSTPEERQNRFDQLHRAHTAAQIIGWSLLALSASDLIYLTFFF